MTDPIADYGRLRNAIMANYRVVEIPASNLKKKLQSSFEKGYILNYKFVDEGPQGTIKIAFSMIRLIKLTRSKIDYFNSRFTA